MGWWIGGAVAWAAVLPDLRTRTIPLWVTGIGAAGAGVAMALGLLPWTQALWALGIAGLYTLVVPARAFGGGDLHLATATALWWGPAAPLVLVGSHLLQALLTLLRFRGRPTPLPWAPFLAAAWLGWTLVH